PDVEHREEHAQKPAVKRHTTLPYRQDIQRVREIVGRFVEQHIAQAPAQDHAQHAEKEQVVEYGVGDVAARTPFDAAAGEHEGNTETDQVHQTVPAHRQRANCD